MTADQLGAELARVQQALSGVHQPRHAPGNLRASHVRAPGLSRGRVQGRHRRDAGVGRRPVAAGHELARVRDDAPERRARHSRRGSAGARGTSVHTARSHRRCAPRAPRVGRVCRHRHRAHADDFAGDVVALAGGGPHRRAAVASGTRMIVRSRSRSRSRSRAPGCAGEPREGRVPERALRRAPYATERDSGLGAADGDAARGGSVDHDAPAQLTPTFSDGGSDGGGDGERARARARPTRAARSEPGAQRARTRRATLRS